MALANDVLIKKQVTEAVINSALDTYCKDTGQLVDDIEINSTVIRVNETNELVSVKYHVKLADRRHCCFISDTGEKCRRDAVFIATWGGAPDDFTEGCSDHIFALVDGDAEPNRVAITVIDK